MNNVVFKLAAVLGIDTSEYDNGLDKAKGDAHSFGGAIGKGLKTAAKIGGAAMAAATTAVVGFGAASVKTGMEFDSSMSQVAATLGLTMSDIQNNVNGAGDTFDALREKAREMGGSTIYSASEAADGLNILAMSGYSAEESMSMVEDVLHLAAAGSMDMASAASYVSGAMKGFNDSTKDSGYYADLMAKGATLANTSVQDLGEAMSSGAAGAAAYGQSADSMTVALLRLAEQGATGSAAGTALAAAMKDLYTGTDQAKAALQELGVDAYDPVTKQARDFNDVVNDLEASMQGMTDEQKNNYKQTIFGIQGLDAYNKMVVSGKEKQDAWAEALAHASDGVGEASKQYDTMTNNLEGSIKGWGSALDDFKIEISDQLTPTLMEFVNFGTGGLQQITKAFQDGGLSGAVDVFGNLLSNGLSMIISKAPDVISAAMDLVGAFGKGLIDNTPQIVNAAVEIVVKLADGLVKGLPELAKGAITLVKSLGQAFSDNAAELQLVGSNLMDLLLDGILNGVPKLISEFAEFFASSFPTLVEKVTGIVVDLALAFTDPTMLGSLMESAITMILALANGLVTAIPQLISAIPIIVQNLVTAIVDNAPMLLEGALSLIGTLAQSIIENLPLIIAAGTQIVFSLVGGLIEMLPTIATSTIRLVGEIVRTILSSLPKFIENGVKIVGAIVQGIVKTIGSVVKAAINLVTQFISSINSFASKIKGVGKEIVDYVKEGLMQKIQDAKNWGADLIENFIGGIKEKIGGLKDAVGGIAETISAPIHFSVPKVGALSDADTYMPDMMKLLAKGIKDNEHLVVDQVRKSFDFGDEIMNATGVINPSNTGNGKMTSLLQQIADSGKNVTIVLEGDAQRLFRVMQYESRKYNQTTGQPAF